VTIRRTGFDAKMMILAATALAAGDEIIDGNDGKFRKNPGTLTGVASEADDNKLTKVAHLLETGDQIEYISGTGGTGLTAGRRYFVSKFSADVFYVHHTLADAITGSSAAVDITLDGTAGIFRVVSPVRGISLQTVAANKSAEAVLF